MDIQTIKPDPLLAEYIDFYYFIRNDAPDFKSRHYSFPHTVNVLSIYQHASFTSSLGKVCIYHDQERPFLTLLQGKCQIPLDVELKGKTNRISIFFKPLGLNQFIHAPLSSFMTKTTNAFSAWDADPEYLNTLSKCFSTTHLQQKINHLERFLLSKLSLTNTGDIVKAIHLLTDFEQHYLTLP